MFRQLPEFYKIVQGIQPRTTTGGFTADYVSLKNALKCYIVINLTQAAAHATLFTPTQATTVAGAGAKALTNTINIWANEDCATSDTFVKQTAAKNYTVTADIKNKQIIFEVDPQALDVANDFDCLTVTVANSGEATNFASIEYFLEMKYKEDVPVSAIVD